jgi:hypothetical protein
MDTVAPTDVEGSTMPGRPPWRRILATAPVAFVMALALVAPTSAASAAASTHSKPALHPYRVGHFHAVGSHWNIKVEHRNLHGNHDVRHADAFHHAPWQGYRYVLVRIGGRLLAQVGGLAYDEKFRLLVGGHALSPAHVDLRHGLEQSGIVNHGQVVTAKIPFLVKHSQLHQQMILRRQPAGLAVRAQVLPHHPLSRSGTLNG